MGIGSMKYECDLCGAEAKILHNIKGFYSCDDHKGLVSCGEFVICEVCLNKLRNYLQATQ